MVLKTHFRTIQRTFKGAPVGQPNNLFFCVFSFSQERIRVSQVIYTLSANTHYSSSNMIPLASRLLTMGVDRGGGGEIPQYLTGAPSRIFMWRGGGGAAQKIMCTKIMCTIIRARNRTHFRQGSRARFQGPLEGPAWEALGLF